MKCCVYAGGSGGHDLDTYKRRDKAANLTRLADTNVRQETGDKDRQRNCYI